jgi:hypothetical protein
MAISHHDWPLVIAVLPAGGILLAFLVGDAAPSMPKGAPVSYSSIPVWHTPPEDRAALELNLGTDFQLILDGGEATNEHAFENCLRNRRLAQLFAELSTEPDPGKAAKGVFDRQLERMQRDIDRLVTAWEEGQHPIRGGWPGRNGVSAGLFLCAELGTLEDVLARIDLWEALYRTTADRIAGIDFRDVRFDDHARDAWRENMLGAGLQLSRTLLRESRPEPLFLVNLYRRLIEKRCGDDVARQTVADIKPLSYMSATNMEQLGVDGNPHASSPQFSVFRSWQIVHQDSHKARVVTAMRQHCDECRNGRVEPAQR